MGKFSLLAALGVLALLAVATRAMRLTGSYSFISREWMHEMRVKCRYNTGSDEAYITLVKAMRSAIKCVKTSVDLENFMSDVDTISNATRNTFFPKYCPQLKRAGPCLGDVVKATRPCMNDIIFKNVRAVASMYPDAVDLVCKTDGEIIFKLAEPKYKECVEKLSDNVNECSVPFAVLRENWDISNLTETQMGTFSGLRQCMEDKLNDCEAPDLIGVYDMFHSTLFRLATSYNVRPFLEQVFVSSVKYMSKLTENENNTVNEK
ncbi:27 kDa glycoprotein-like isoform X1 [Anopheles coustani]|uniref:27 kDa glycoprotein-like isoform X1 n=1 Tax=Anopheles coustani TaxID=139045 RepID=UPI002658EC70|nr:27 kDa glycoprotein-like isoform X1 [Anopheles coustani]